MRNLNDLDQLHAFDSENFSKSDLTIILTMRSTVFTLGRSDEIENTEHIETKNKTMLGLESH